MCIKLAFQRYLFWKKSSKSSGSSFNSYPNPPPYPQISADIRSGYQSHIRICTTLAHAPFHQWQRKSACMCFETCPGLSLPLCRSFRGEVQVSCLAFAVSRPCSYNLAVWLGINLYLVQIPLLMSGSPIHVLLTKFLARQGAWGILD